MATDENELEQIMEKIEKKQAEIDEIQEQNAALKQQVQQLQSEIATSKIVNKTVSLNVIKTRSQNENNESEIDLSLFNGEHKDLLNEIQNQIIKLQQKTLKRTNKNSNIENEILLLISENSEIENQTENFKLKIKQAKREQKSLQDDIQFKQSQIKSMDDDIATIKRSMKDAETSIIVLTNRKNSLANGPNSPAALQKEIETVTIQTYEAQNRIDELEDNLHNMTDASNERTQQQQKEKEKVTGLIGWDEERSMLQEEKESLRDQLQKLKSQTPKTDSKIQLLQKRYNGLRTLARKWGKSEDLPTYEADADEAPDIDTLLQTALSRQNSNSDDSIKGTPVRSSQNTPHGTPLAKQNVASETMRERKPQLDKLEGKITSMKSELDRKLTMFRTDEKYKVTSIEDQRKNMFDVEEQLINKIQETQLKIALKKK